MQSCLTNYSTAVYLRNRSPTTAVDDSTPFEALTGIKPDVKHLRVFGCTAHIAKDEQQKLDPKARKNILMGHTTEKSGYHLYDPKRGEVFYSRNVKFKELECSVEESTEQNERKYIELELPCDDEVTSDIPAEQVPRQSEQERKPPMYYGEWANF